MNASRRMAALQSRAFAAAGVAVLQIDLGGCGDSEGELRDMTWAKWHEDLAHAASWLSRHASTDISLWGLRLGAALAVDFCRASPVSIRQCILWQAVLSGHAYVTQLLRLNLAADMFASGDPARASTNALRDALRRGATVEAGGYELTSELIDSIDRIDLSHAHGLACPVHWFEIMSGKAEDLPVARANAIGAWSQANMDLNLVKVSGPPFWATKEITECPELITATTLLFTRERA